MAEIKLRNSREFRIERLSVCLGWLMCNFSLFLLLFIGLTILFATIHESHCTIQLIFQLFFFITLFTKSFQFQLNKLFPNGH